MLYPVHIFIRLTVIVALLPVFIHVLTPTASAQETMNNASAGGRVTDSSGAAVSGASVVVRQTETNLSSASTTDQDGRFRFPYLKPGPYEIRIQSAGFSDVTRSVTLTVGSAFEWSVSLGVAPLASTASVMELAEIIETARTQIAGTVPQDEIQILPLAGRSYLEAALLIPGVSPTNTASNQLFAETSAVPGQGISINSQRNFSNSFIVDGLSANDDASGLAGNFYGLDSIREFQVVTSGGQAEFGRALGGYMNVITKSGTNTVHGDAYGFFRNQRFNAANPISHTVLPVTQAQYGVSLGGPVVRDRTFYFGNFERRELNQSGLITITPANVDAINTRLMATGYPGPLIATGIYPNPVHSTTFLARMDHHFSDKNQFSIRYSLYDVNSRNSRGAGGLNAESASAGLDNTDQTIALTNIATFSSRLVNETRAQFTHGNLKAPPTDAIGPTVSISGVASFGTLSTSPAARLNKLYEVVDNLSYQSGAHSIRVGVDFLYNKDTITFPRSFRGNYSFSSLANFLSGTYNNSGFTQTFNNSVVSQTNPNIGVYAQDEWKVNPHLTLNFGVRYDLQYLKTIATDTNNLAPRVGFVWTPTAARTTVIRGSFGLFYDRVPLRALANALLSAGNTADPANLSQTSLSLSPTQSGAPVFPNTLASLALPPDVLFNFTTMNSHMENAYSEQISLEVERQIGRSMTASVGYQHVRGLHLIIAVNQNVPSCAASGTNNGCRPNPAIANNNQYSPLADSYYDGLHISFLQRPARWGSYRVSYTYSKAFDNVGEFFFSSPIDNFNIWQDYSRSDDDQRHRLVFNGAIHSSMEDAKTLWERLSHGFEISSMVQYYSALPFNVTAGVNTIQGTPARPTVDGAFISRNAGAGFDYFNVNARLSRTFQISERYRMEATLESFNLFNHVNGVALNGVFGTGAYPASPLPTFKQVTAVADPRTLQLGLRVSF
jgi:outer membrane receptor protein involved in Fe transport